MSNQKTLSTLRVLLVDDESFVRRVIATMLKTLGIAEIYEAENGCEAIRSLAAHEVDLLVTDIQMPEMNGIELIKQVRMGKTVADRGLRSIVVTSFSYTEVLSSCLLLDVNGFLVKPITAANAKEKIQYALNEQLHLHPSEAYLQVKTDLALLDASSKKEQKRQNAAIVIETPESESTALRHTQKPSSGGKFVSLRNLKPGMELLDDLYANTGVKLLPKGRVLTEVLVNRIRELYSVIDQREIRIKSI